MKKIQPFAARIKYYPLRIGNFSIFEFLLVLKIKARYSPNLNTKKFLEGKKLKTLTILSLGIIATGAAALFSHLTNETSRNSIGTEANLEEKVWTRTDKRAALKDADRKSALATALANFPELELVAEVDKVQCEGRTCTINIKTLTTLDDPKFQNVMPHFHQENYKWLGPLMLSPTEENDGNIPTTTIQYIYSLGS